MNLPIKSQRIQCANQDPGWANKNWLSKSIHSISRLTGTCKEFYLISYMFICNRNVATGHSCLHHWNCAQKHNCVILQILLVGRIYLSWSYYTWIQPLVDEQCFFEFELYILHSQIISYCTPSTKVRNHFQARG